MLWHWAVAARRVLNQSLQWEAGVVHTWDPVLGYLELFWGHWDEEGISMYARRDEVPGWADEDVGSMVVHPDLKASSLPMVHPDSTPTE